MLSLIIRWKFTEYSKQEPTAKGEVDSIERVVDEIQRDFPDQAHEGSVHARGRTVRDRAGQVSENFDLDKRDALLSTFNGFAGLIERRRDVTVVLDAEGQRRSTPRASKTSGRNWRNCESCRVAGNSPTSNGPWSSYFAPASPDTWPDVRSPSEEEPRATGALFSCLTVGDGLLSDRTNGGSERLSRRSHRAASG